MRCLPVYHRRWSVLCILNALSCAGMYRGNVIPTYVGIQIRGHRLHSRVREHDDDAACAVYCTPPWQDCGQQGKRRARFDFLEPSGHNSSDVALTV